MVAMINFLTCSLISSFKKMSLLRGTEERNDSSVVCSLTNFQCARQISAAVVDLAASKAPHPKQQFPRST